MMTPQFLFLLIFLLFLVLIAGTKHVGKNQRMVVYRKDKPVAVKGPGKVFLLPHMEEGKLIDVSVCSSPIPEIKIEGTKFDLVKGTYAFQVVNPLKAEKNADIKQLTEQSLVSTLVAVLSTATVRECLKEKFALENKVLEGVNRKTINWGTRVMTLEFCEIQFPREVLSQIALILDQLVISPGSLIEEAARQSDSLDLR
jgi:regulator of protease activity HflC (stomatin/prohibitin superfamily)